ncbi:MAG TPA: lytic transglycosylase domain-containing protein [Chitinophagales bacterium]|nr:lytic transglycosylase domain-containing protein [Chitinophagales bacterium]
MKIKSQALNKFLRIAIFMLAGFAVFFSISTMKAKVDPESTSYITEKIRSPFDNKIYAVKIPEHIDFAGEEVPLDDEDVRQHLDRELLVNAYWHSQTLYIMKQYQQIISLLEPILQRYAVPKDFEYLCVAESGLQYNAESPSGAVGLWQFTRSTGIHYGLIINSEVDERYSYEKSTEAACKYFLDGKQKFGSWTMAAAAFNHGMDGMGDAVKHQKTNNYYDLYLNRETSRYIFRILALKQVLGNPQAYGFFLDAGDMYPDYKYKTITVDSSITDLADFAKANGTSYKTLRELNPWIMAYSLTNKEKRVYELKLPI